MCLRQGCVPDDLKVARVTPIYKSGSKDDFSNYRPISILPICSKILEKIVHKQLYVYVSDNQLVYDGQSGFRKQHSTCTALRDGFKTQPPVDRRFCPVPPGFDCSKQ